MQLDLKKVEKIIKDALSEDIGKGDITSNLTIPENSTINAKFVPRKKTVICGIPVLEKVFSVNPNNVKYTPQVIEGSIVDKGVSVFNLSGEAKAILSHERVALNLLQYMSGIANITRDFVEEVAHTNVKILDTRKTIPNLRILAKYAVWIGGGKNHRFCLDDGILIKDNHISLAGGITKAVEKARIGRDKQMKVEIECDTLEQVREALDAKADIILLDNMEAHTLEQAVKINNGQSLLEASGNINIKNVKEVAETGVDFISIGALTHSAPWVDIGLDIE